MYTTISVSSVILRIRARKKRQKKWKTFNFFSASPWTKKWLRDVLPGGRNSRQRERLGHGSSTAATSNTWSTTRRRHDTLSGAERRQIQARSASPVFALAPLILHYKKATATAEIHALSK